MERVRLAAIDVYNLSGQFRTLYVSTKLVGRTLRTLFATCSTLYTAGWCALEQCPARLYLMWLALPAGRFRRPAWRASRPACMVRWPEAGARCEDWARLVSHCLLLSEYKRRLRQYRCRVECPVQVIQRDEQRDRFYSEVGGGWPSR